MSLTQQEKGLVSKRPTQLASVQHELATTTQPLAAEAKELATENDAVQKNSIKNLVSQTIELPNRNALRHLKLRVHRSKRKRPRSRVWARSASTTRI